MVTDGIGGLPLVMVLWELLEVVEHSQCMSSKSKIGTELCGLKSTINSIIPVILKMNLDLRGKRIDYLKQQMIQGMTLVHTCSTEKFPCSLAVRMAASELKMLNRSIINTLGRSMIRLLYKSQKNSGSTDKNDKLISSESDDGHALGDDSNKLYTDRNRPEGVNGGRLVAVKCLVRAHHDSDKLYTDRNRPVDGGVFMRKVGKLFVTNTEIAKGSNGTVVYEGVYGGRPVAVKRLVRAHHDLAFKEIQNLMKSDAHPNIVRWHGVETDRDFVYLSLERCTCSLDDLIQICLDSSNKSSSFDEGQTTKTLNEYKLRLDSVKSIMQDLNLWKPNGRLSPLLLKLMGEIVSGLVHLHRLGIIHRDLKPANVLIIKETSLCAKLSDMGISKRLPADMSSFSRATGCGSSGWQAPEQLCDGPQTRAVDLFSLGCVLYFFITGGKHPFGEGLERDINIKNNNVNLSSVKWIPEAEDLISRLLNADPKLRPSASQVLHHPLFWSSERRLLFLCETSDRLELGCREKNSALLVALESTALVGPGAEWDAKMERVFIAHLVDSQSRRGGRCYKFDRVKDLLRVIRNKMHHYGKLPKEIQALVGPVPEGFDEYFASRIPRLLMEVYKVVHKYCRDEECYQKYFKSDIL